MKTSNPRIASGKKASSLHIASGKRTSDLRVASGKYRGQRLRSPESSLTHPMGAREKLALFNLLQPIFLANTPASPQLAAKPSDAKSPDIYDGPKVLDLYAGSGALGIEALSRGAGEVVFVEKSPRIARLISENLASLKDSQPAKVFTESVASFCKRPEYLAYFDIIIADPPYNNFHPEDLANISQILSPTGILILSSPAKADPPTIPGLQQETTRTYAGARLTIYYKSIDNI